MIADYTGCQKETILKFGVHKAGAVLDVGCGDGDKTAHIAQHVQSVVGIDPYEKAIRLARRRHPSPALAFLAAQSEALCFARASFDTVLFNESLHHVPVDRQVDALKEAQRVLTPGGRLLITEPRHGSGTFAGILKFFPDEAAQKQAARGAVDSVTDAGFNLSFKKEIQIVYHCQGFDDLLAYCAMPSPGDRWEDLRPQVRHQLKQCPQSATGAFFLDYTATVWLLVKR